MQHTLTPFLIRAASKTGGGKKEKDNTVRQGEGEEEGEGEGAV